MKLSLKRVLKEAQDDLEDWSKEIEGDSPTQEPEDVDVQKVWGGKSLEDERPQNMEEFYEQNGITEQEFNSWVDEVHSTGFTPQLYQKISQRVGDMDNFLVDVQNRAPQLYSFFQNSGLQNSIPQLQANPQSAKKLGSGNHPKNSIQGNASMDQIRAAQPYKSSKQQEPTNTIQFNKNKQRMQNPVSQSYPTAMAPKFDPSAKTNPGMKLRKALRNG